VRASLPPQTTHEDVRRARKDPFEQVWPDVLVWLDADPDTTAKALMERLLAEHPDCFHGGQLRTLQRRVQAWRRERASALLQVGTDCVSSASRTDGMASSSE